MVIVVNMLGCEIQRKDLSILQHRKLKSAATAKEKLFECHQYAQVDLRVSVGHICM